MAPKKWWQTVKSFLGKNSDNDIPPIDDGEKVNFTNNDKADAFNNFFSKNATLDSSNASLPIFMSSVNSCKLSKITANQQDVIDVLKSIDINKATEPDEISPKILREAGAAIAPSLTPLINLSLSCNTFPDPWKLANVMPLYKKDDKTQINNYRPISLPSCVSKIMECVVFKYIFNFLKGNGQLSRFQSGFIPGDSTTCQLVQVYHLLCEALDNKKDVRVIFCDISKAFDRVWHDGLLCKLQRIGICDDLLKWYKSYLMRRKQKVVLGNTKSRIGEITAGVPQGSVLGPLLFLIFINDITENTNCNIRLFADDTTLFVDFDNVPDGAELINNDLQTIYAWANKWLVSFCPSKTESLLVSSRNGRVQPTPVYFGGSPIQEVDSHQHLGITLTKNLSWNIHVENIVNKARKRVDIMAYLKYRLDRSSLETIYKSFIRPILEYGDILLSNMTDEQATLIEQLNKRAGSIISGATRGTSSATIYNELAWVSMAERRKQHRLCAFHKITNNVSPQYLRECIPRYTHEVSNYNLRNADTLERITARTSRYLNSFFPLTVREWNLLPSDIRHIQDFDRFKSALTKEYPISNKLYAHGQRKTNILHARIRMGCSGLNAHLFQNYITDSPRCACGDPYEDPLHYLVACPRFEIQRNDLQMAISEITSCSIGTILYGSRLCTTAQNKMIFDSVQLYIRRTGRFR